MNDFLFMSLLFLLWELKLIQPFKTLKPIFIIIIINTKMLTGYQNILRTHTHLKAHDIKRVWTGIVKCSRTHRHMKSCCLAAQYEVMCLCVLYTLDWIQFVVQAVSGFPARLLTLGLFRNNGLGRMDSTLSKRSWLMTYVPCYANFGSFKAVWFGITDQHLKESYFRFEFLWGVAVPSMRSLVSSSMRYFICYRVPT